MGLPWPKPTPRRKHYHMEGPWGTQEACWEDHGAEGGTAQPLDTSGDTESGKYNLDALVEGAAAGNFPE